MDREEIKRRVINVVCHVLNVEPDMVTLESDLVFDLGAESRQSIELIAAFEAEFDIDMDEDDALEVQTIGGAVDFIGRYVPAGA